MKLKPYIQAEVNLARAAQAERFWGLAALRYERAVLLARGNPRQQAFVYYRMSWFWLKQRCFAQARQSFSAGNQRVFKTSVRPTHPLPRQSRPPVHRT